MKDIDNNENYMCSGGSPMPTSASDGDFGVLPTCSTVDLFNKTITSTYAIKADGAGNLLVTRVDYMKYISGDKRSTSVYQVTPTGDVRPISSSVDYFYLGSVFKNITTTFQ
jgi:hypothetical protein